MNPVMTKGLRIYTAALFLAAVLVFVAAVPQLSVLAGMAVLLAVAGVMASAIGGDLRAVENDRFVHEP